MDVIKIETLTQALKYVSIFHTVDIYSDWEWGWLQSAGPAPMQLRMIPLPSSSRGFPKSIPVSSLSLPPVLCPLQAGGTDSRARNEPDKGKETFYGSS